MKDEAEERDPFAPHPEDPPDVAARKAHAREQLARFEAGRPRREHKRKEWWDNLGLHVTYRNELIELPATDAEALIEKEREGFEVYDSSTPGTVRLRRRHPREAVPDYAEDERARVVWEAQRRQVRLWLQWEQKQRVNREKLFLHVPGFELGTASLYAVPGFPPGIEYAARYGLCFDTEQYRRIFTNEIALIRKAYDSGQFRDLDYQLHTRLKERYDGYLAEWTERLERAQARLDGTAPEDESGAVGLGAPDLGRTAFKADLLQLELRRLDAGIRPENGHPDWDKWLDLFEVPADVLEEAYEAHGCGASTEPVDRQALREVLPDNHMRLRWLAKQFQYDPSTPKGQKAYKDGRKWFERWSWYVEQWELASLNLREIDPCDETDLKDKMTKWRKRDQDARREE